MASSPSISTTMALSNPTIAFLVETRKPINSSFAAQFLAILDICVIEHYWRNGIRIEDNSTKLESISVGSLLGEIAAVVVDHLSFRDIQNLIAGFVPMIGDAIHFLTSDGKRGKAPTSNVKDLLQTVSEAIVVGDITQVTISNPQVTFNGDVIINIHTSEKIFEKRSSQPVIPRFNELGRSSAPAKLFQKYPATPRKLSGEKWVAEFAEEIGVRELIISDAWVSLIEDGLSTTLIGEPRGERHFHVIGVGWPRPAKRIY